MYFRHILRRQLIGTRTAHFNPLHRVCGAQVAALKITSLFLIYSFFLLSSAEHFDNNCPTSSGGGCGEPAEPHHQEVWSIVHPHKSFWLYASSSFELFMMCLSDPTETNVHQKRRGEAGRGGQQEVWLPSSNHLLQSHWQKHPCRYHLWRWEGKQTKPLHNMVSHLVHCSTWKVRDEHNIWCNSFNT